jgi:chemotaxis protein CheY-P-specific phosphatase CheC
MGDVQQVLNEADTQAICDVGSLVFKSASLALSKQLDQEVYIGSPYPEALTWDELVARTNQTPVMVMIEQRGGPLHAHIIAFARDVAMLIAELMLAKVGQPVAGALDSVKQSALCEAANVMFAAAAVALSPVVGSLVTISTPLIDFNGMREPPISEAVSDEHLIVVRYDLQISGSFMSEVQQIMKLHIARRLAMLARVTRMGTLPHTRGPS